MHGRIRELREELALAVIPRERLPVLDELSRLADPAEGKACARELMSLASSVRGKRWMATGYLRLADHERVLADYSHASAHLKKAWRLLQNDPACLSEKAQLFRSLGILSYFYKGSLAVAVEYSRFSLSCARRAGNPPEIVRSLCSLGQLYVQQNRIDDAVDVLEESLDLCRAASLPEEIADVRSGLAMLSIAAGDCEYAERHLHTCLILFRDKESEKGEADIYEKLGHLCLHRERFDQALEYYRKSARLFRDHQDRERCVAGALHIGRACSALGKTDQALRYMERSVAYGVRTGNRIVLASGLLGKGEIHVEKGEWEKGIDLLTRAHDIFIHVGAEREVYQTIRILAKAYEKGGRWNEALQCCRRMMGYEKDAAGITVQGKVLAFPLRERFGRAEKRKEAVRERKETLESEVERRMKEATVGALRLAQNSRLLEQLRNHLLAVKAAGERDDATLNHLIRRIDNRTECMDARNAFEHRLRVLDGQFASVLTDRFKTLTPSEVCICSLLNVGMSNREISALLNISGRTVDTHRTRIRRKMGLEPEEDLAEELKALSKQKD